MSENKDNLGTEKKETPAAGGNKQADASNPLLSKPMETKAYAGNTTSEAGLGTNVNAPIPEPTFTRPPGREAPNAQPAGSETAIPKAAPMGGGQPQSGPSSNGAAPKPGPQQSVNPHYSGYSGADKKYGAAQLATMAVATYEKLWSFPQKWILVSDKKIDKLHKEGKIDVNMPVPYMGEEVQAKDLIQAYNEENTGILTVSPEFKKEVIPLLTEIFEERGIGMSKEQYLGFLVLQDSAGKAVLAGNAMMARNELFNILGEATEHYKKLAQKMEAKQQEAKEVKMPGSVDSVFPTGKERVVETFTEKGEKAETIQAPVQQAPIIKMDRSEQASAPAATNANNSNDIIEDAQVISETPTPPANVIVTTGEGSKKETPKGKTEIVPDNNQKERNAEKKKAEAKVKRQLKAATKRGGRNQKGGNDIVFP